MSLRRAAQTCLTNRQLHKLGNAFIPLDSNEEHLRQLVREADAQRGRDPQAARALKSPLDGCLIALKDNICTKDLPTTCASGMLKDYVSPFDATVVQLLKRDGAIIAGKTNMDEFGMGSHSTYSFFGPVRNVIGDNVGSARSVGGSSGGSALAVATGQCFAALGTDTGGSVRLPAAYTGTVGFKPSYGLISRWGVVAYANSLDTVGILANTTKVTRDMFETLNEHDSQDPTSLSKSSRTRIAEQARERRNTERYTIGVPLEYNIEELDPVVKRAWLRSIQHFKDQGHKIVPVSLSATKQALPAYYILAPSEASSNLAKYDGVRYGSRAEGADTTGPDGVLYSRTRGRYFGDEVQSRILLGTFSLSAEVIDSHFIQAQRIRRLVQDDFDRVFRTPNPLLPRPTQDPSSSSSSSSSSTTDAKTDPGGDADRVDLLLCPTAPTLPPLLKDLKTQSPLDTYTNDVFTVPASLAGLPAINVPVAMDPRDQDNHPDVPSVGMQLIGQYGDDIRVLEVAHAFEHWASPRRATAVSA